VLADAGSIPAASTIIQKTNRSRLVFFRPFPPVLARFRALPLEHVPPDAVVPGAYSAVFLSLFSPPLLSIQDPKSCIHAGFEATGLRWWLLGSARPKLRITMILIEKSTFLADRQQVLVDAGTE